MIVGQSGPHLAKTAHDHGMRGGGERQRTLLICQTPIAAAVATTAVAPNRAG
jgi:hypothetical protein